MRNQHQSYGYTNSTANSGNSGYSRGGQGSGSNSNYSRGEKRGGASNTSTTNSSSYQGASYNNTSNTQGGGAATYYQGERNAKEYKSQSEAYEGSNYQGRSTYNGSQKQQTSKRGGAPSYANSKRYPPSGSTSTQHEDPYYEEGGQTAGKYYGEEYYEEDYYNYEQEPDYSRQASSSKSAKKHHEEQYYQESYQKPSRGQQQQNNIASRGTDHRHQDGYQDYYNEEEEAAYQQQQDSYYKATPSGGTNKDQYPKKSKNYQEEPYHQPTSSDSYNKQQKTNQAPADYYGKKNDYDQRQKRGGGGGAKSSNDYRGSSTQGYPSYRTTASKRGGGDSHQKYGDNNHYYGNEKEVNEHDYYYEQETFQEDYKNKKTEDVDKKALNKQDYEENTGYQYRPKKFTNPEESKNNKIGKQIIIQTGQGASKKDDIPLSHNQFKEFDDKFEQNYEDEISTPMPAQPHRTITINKQEPPSNYFPNIEEINKRQREDSNASWATVEEQFVDNQANCTASTLLHPIQKDQKSQQKPSPLQQKQDFNKLEPNTSKQSEQIQGQVPTIPLQGQASVKSESPNLRHQNSERHSNYLAEDDLEHHILQNIPDPEYKELDTKKNSPNHNYHHQAHMLANQFNQQMSLDPALKDTGIPNNWNGAQQINAINQLRHVTIVRQPSEEMTPQQYMQHRQVIYNHNIALQHQQNQHGGHPSPHPIQHHILHSPSPIMQDRQHYPQYSPQPNNYHHHVNSPYGGESGYQDQMLYRQTSHSTPVGNNYPNASSFRHLDQLEQQQQAMQYMNFNQQHQQPGIENGMMQRQRIDQMSGFPGTNILHQHLSDNLNPASEISPIQYHHPQLHHSHSMQEEGSYLYHKRSLGGGINQIDNQSQNTNINGQYQAMPQAQLNHNAKEFVPSFKKKITNQMSNVPPNNQMREGHIVSPLIGNDQYFQSHNSDLNYQAQQQIISLEQQQYIQYMQHQKQLQQLNAYGSSSNSSQVHNPIQGLREQSSGNTVLYDNSPSYQTQAQMIQYQTQQQMMMTSQNNFQHPYYSANSLNQGPNLENNHYNNREDDQDNFENNGDQYDPDNNNQPDVSSFNFMLNLPDIMQQAQYQFPNNGFNH